MWRVSIARTTVARTIGVTTKRFYSTTGTKVNLNKVKYGRSVTLGALALAGVGSSVYLLQKNTSLISVVSADTKEDYFKGNKPTIDNNYNNYNNNNNNSKGYNDMFSKYGLIAMGALVFAVSSAIVLKSCYKRCPSNKVLVVYGLVGKESSKCIHGGGTFVIPVFQSYKYISLEPMQIDVNLKAALSKENIRLTVPSYFTVAVGIDETTMTNAADRILDMDREALNKQAQDIIFGQMREVIATLSVEEIKGDRLNFVKGVNDSVECELKKIGLTLINVNITDIQDESGYLTALGKKAAEGAIQQALIDVSERRKSGEIGVSQNNSERVIGVKLAEQQSAIETARLEKDQLIFRGEAQNEIAIKNALQEKQSKSAIAAAQADTAVAQAKARADQKAREKTEELNLRVAVAKAEAQAVTTETDSNIQIAELQTRLKVKQADAFRQQKEADALMKEAETLANVRVAIANSQLVEAEKRAEFEASAKAFKAQVILQAEAKAEQILIEAKAEAEAMLIRLEAEARGKGETLKVKGDGLKRIIEACGSSEQAYKLLMLDHIDHIVDATARATANIKFDKVVVWDSGNNATGNFVKSITNIIPPALNMVKDIGGLDIQNVFSNLLGQSTNITDPTTNSELPKEAIVSQVENSEKSETNPKMY